MKSYEQFSKEPFAYNFRRRLLNNVQKRAKSNRNNSKNHSTGNIAIVAHGGILKVIIIELLGWDISFYKQFWLGNTFISTIQLKQNGKHILRHLNDMGHL